MTDHEDLRGRRNHQQGGGRGHCQHPDLLALRVQGVDEKVFVKKIKWTKLLSYYWYIINIKPCKITLHIYLNYTSINTKALYIEYKVSAVAYHN